MWCFRVLFGPTSEFAAPPRTNAGVPSGGGGAPGAPPKLPAKNPAVSAGTTDNWRHRARLCFRAASEGGARAGLKVIPEPLSERDQCESTHPSKSVEDAATGKKRGSETRSGGTAPSRPGASFSSRSRRWGAAASGRLAGGRLQITSIASSPSMWGGLMRGRPAGAQGLHLRAYISGFAIIST